MGKIIPLHLPILLIFYLILCKNISGQPWTTYNTGCGLANNVVKKIAIENSTKWFATDGGVSKFTGTTWTTYDVQDGLVSNHVNAVAIDAQGRKWFGTAYGVSMLDGTTWTTYTTADGLVNNYVYDVAIDNSGNIWFGTSGGASRFDGATWTTFKEGYSVFVIEKDPLGNIWLGPGGKGLCKFDGTNWTDYTTDSGLVSESIYAIAFDLAGNKWIGTNRGVSKFDDQNWMTIHKSDGLPEEDVYAVAIDALNNKWFGTWEGGLAEFDDVNWTYYTELDGLASDKIWDIVIDSEGNLWIATGGGGVSKYDGSPPLKNGPDWRWANGNGGNYNAYSNAAYAGEDGDLFFAGAFGGDSIIIGNTVLHNTGGFTGNDILYGKTDPGGTILWAKSTGGTGYDEGYGITGDMAGSFFMTGRFQSDSIAFDFVNFQNSGPAGTGDVFLCKYSTDGELLWANQLGGTEDDIGQSVATDATGNAYITGSLDGNIFLASFNPTGNMLWLKKATGDGQYNKAEKIITDIAGNIYICGSFGGSFIQFGNTALQNTGQTYSDGFLYKFSPTGEVLWAASASGPEWETVSGMACDPKGNLYFTGSFNGSSVNINGLDLYNTGISYYDFFLVKMGSDGVLHWGQRGGGSSSDFGNDVAIDSLCNVYLTGEYKSQTLTIGNTTLPNAGYNDIFLAKYDTSGSASWVKRVGGNWEDHARKITTDGDGNIFLTGNFVSNVIKFDSILLTNNEYYDLFNAKLGSYISSNSPVCEGSTLLLFTDSIPGAQYAWHGPSGFYSAQRNPVVSDQATPVMAGKYYLKLSVNGQDYHAGHTTVIVRPVPPQPVASCISVPCTGYPLKLTVTSEPGATFSWTGPNGFHSSLQSPVVSDSALITMSGLYFVSEHIKSCSDLYASVEINIHESPPVPVITWNAPNLFSTDAYKYKWFLNGDEIPGDTLQICTPHQNGSYKVVITDINGCQAISDDFSLISYGISDNTEFGSASVIPNPTTGIVNITLPSGVQSATILDIKGTIVMSIPIKQQKNIVCKIERPGVYILFLEGDYYYSPSKIVVVN